MTGIVPNAQSKKTSDLSKLEEVNHPASDKKHTESQEKTADMAESIFLGELSSRLKYRVDNGFTKRDESGRLVIKTGIDQVNKILEAFLKAHGIPCSHGDIMLPGWGLQIELEAPAEAKLRKMLSKPDPLAKTLRNIQRRLKLPTTSTTSTPANLLDSYLRSKPGLSELCDTIAIKGQFIFLNYSRLLFRA